MSYCSNILWHIYGDDNATLWAKTVKSGFVFVTLAECRDAPTAAAAYLREQCGEDRDIGGIDDVSDAVYEHVTKWEGMR